MRYDDIEQEKAKDVKVKVKSLATQELTSSRGRNSVLPQAKAALQAGEPLFLAGSTTCPCSQMPAPPPQPCLPIALELAPVGYHSSYCSYRFVLPVCSLTVGHAKIPL